MHAAQGSAGDHKLIRQRVCDYMLANRASFEPFVEDDERFDDYMRVRGSSVHCAVCTLVRAELENTRQEMMTDGSWAGQVCMQPYKCPRCVTFCQDGSYARSLLLRHKRCCSQMELQATSLVSNVNIVLHQAGQVR